MKTTLQHFICAIAQSAIPFGIYQIGEQDSYQLVNMDTRTPIDRGTLHALSRKYSVVREAVAMGELA